MLELGIGIFTLELEVEFLDRVKGVRISHTLRRNSFRGSIFEGHIFGG